MIVIKLWYFKMAYSFVYSSKLYALLNMDTMNRDTYFSLCLIISEKQGIALFSCLFMINVHVTLARVLWLKNIDKDVKYIKIFQ